MRGYIVLHKDWGVMKWSKAERRLVAATHIRIVDRWMGGRGITPFCNAGEARIAVNATLVRMNLGSESVGDFYLVPIALTAAAKGGTR